MSSGGFVETERKNLMALDKELNSFIYLLVNYAHFSYRDVTSMSLPEFTAFYEMALEQYTAEQEQIAKLNNPK